MILQIDTRDSATVDEALLILNALKSADIVSTVATEVKKEEPTTKVEAPKVKPKKEQKEAPKEEPKVVEEKDWYNECRKLLITISKGADEKKMDEIKNLLASFGGTKLSDVPQERLKDLYEALEGLNG